VAPLPLLLPPISRPDLRPHLGTCLLPLRDVLHFPVCYTVNERLRLLHLNKATGRPIKAWCASCSTTDANSCNISLLLAPWPSAATGRPRLAGGHQNCPAVTLRCPHISPRPARCEGYQPIYSVFHLNMSSFLNCHPVIL